MPLVSGVAGTYPTTYSVLLTTTIQAYRKTLVDAISEAIPVWWWMNQRERKMYQSGGESILQPLMFRLNTVQTFDGLDTLETTTKEGLTPAVFLWKHYHTSVVILRIHLRHNVGEAKVLDLLDAQMQQAKISFQDQLNTDTVANTTDAKGIEGLAAIITDPATQTIYGGINDSANTWWQNQETNASSAFGSAGLNQMRILYYECTRGNERPDLMVMTEAAYLNYDRSQVDNKRYVNTTALDAGFENVAFHGMTIIFDRATPANSAFMINTNYLQLIVDPEVEFEPDDFYNSHDHYAIISRIFWRGNLTCSNRARQGLLRNADTF